MVLKSPKISLGLIYQIFFHRLKSSLKQPFQTIQKCQYPKFSWLRPSTSTFNFFSPFDIHQTFLHPALTLIVLSSGPQSGKDGRSGEDFPCAHPIWQRGAVCKAIALVCRVRKRCTPGVHKQATSTPAVHDTTVRKPFHSIQSI